MKRIAFIILLSLPVAQGQLIKLLPSWTTYSSKGLFDHRGGFSFYSVSKVKSFSEKARKVSLLPAVNVTTPDALVVPTNCLLTVY